MHTNRFEALNKLFDKIYVLTIERARERQIAFSNHFKGLNYSFFYGIDKNDINEIELEKQQIYNPLEAQKNDRYHRKMKIGELACALGHQSIYKDIIENNYTKVLILEDDVVTCDLYFTSYLNDILNNIPDDWELVYFDYLKNDTSNFLTKLKQFVYQIQGTLGFLNLTSLSIKNLYATKYNQYFKKAGYHMYTSAYCINQKTAKLLLQQQTPIKFVADHLLAYCITNNLIIGYIANPKIFKQLSQTNKTKYGSLVEN
jgi:glycosyl transferase family 25